MISVRSKWPGVGGVDAEIGRQFHRAAHALGNVAKRAVAEDGELSAAKKLSFAGRDRAQIILDQLGMFFTTSENEQKIMPLPPSFFLEGCRDRNAIQDRVNGNVERRFCSSREMPGLFKVAAISWSISSRLPAFSCFLAAE